MSTPTFDPDDPRLTAYALGESSPAERAAVEELLAASPEAREEVEQTRALVRMLEAEYRQENVAYWDARGSDPLPGKVVKFPVSRKSMIASVCKVAALIVALGMLLTFAMRRWSSPSITTLASSRQVEGLPLPAPTAAPSLEATPAARELAKAEGSVSASPAQPPTVAPATSATPATTDSLDSLLAMDSDRAQRDKDTLAPSLDRSAPEPAAPSVRRASSADAPAGTAPAASAAALGGAMTSPQDRIALSLVRIRAGDGSYVGGVIVTPDGSILAAQPLPMAEARPTVILADHREVSAAISRDQTDAGFYRLRINGTAFPTVALAAAAPSDKELLTVATTDRRTGATRFLRAQALVSGSEARIQWDDRPPADDEPGFAFNADGELLAITTAPPAQGKAQARVASRRVTRTEPRVRPFTDAERASLQPATANPSR